MLTIMIPDANPGISPPSPPHKETGYYLNLTGSNILLRPLGQPMGGRIGVTSAPKTRGGKGEMGLHEERGTDLV